MHAVRSALPVVGFLAGQAFMAAPASAQADFYKGKTIELVISTGVGGGLDANARMVARHLGNYIPGRPTVVPKNMPGAGHLQAANYVFSTAPQDGTTIGTFIPAFITAYVLERSKNIQFNPAEFQWLVSTASSNQTVYVMSKSGVKTVQDAMQREVLMGGTGVGSYTVLYPTVMNNTLGTKFKIVTGYRNTAEINIAMERGEIQGRAGNNLNSLKVEHGEWLKTGKINILTQVGVTRDPEFPDVPLLAELATTQAVRQVLELFSADVVIGRPFVTGPSVPAARIAILRDAFQRMLKDAAFLAEAKKTQIEIEPVEGDRIQTIVKDLVSTPSDVVARAKAAMVQK